MNLLKRVYNQFYENASGYLRLIIIAVLIVFAIYVLDRGYIKGLDQWWFLGAIALLVIHFLDNGERKYSDK